MPSTTSDTGDISSKQQQAQRKENCVCGGACVCACMCACVCVRACMCVHVCVCVRACVYVCKEGCVYMHTHIHACSRARAHTHTHTHTHTCTHTHLWRSCTQCSGMDVRHVGERKHGIIIHSRRYWDNWNACKVNTKFNTQWTERQRWERVKWASVNGLKLKGFTLGGGNVQWHF